MLYSALKSNLSSGTLLVNEPLKGYTSFKIGGPAEYLVISNEIDEIRRIVLLANDMETPYYIIGNGSNLLVSDAGVKGIVIVLKQGRDGISLEDEGETVLVKAHAGCMLSAVAMEAARGGLTGMEFAAGIPGTIGGAVFMNAGAYGGEIKDCITEALVMDADGVVFTLSRDELELSYRHSVISEQNLIVLEAQFRLQKADSSEVLSKITELNSKRREKQPLEYPSAGSTFKRPEGYFAGKLIEDAGLKGFSVGGACVSEKHCGFVINKGNATAQDVMELIEEVSKRVETQFGVRLDPEVRMLGF